MKTLLSLVLLFSAAAPLQAGNWPQFRGPSFNGSTPEKGLPTQWSPTENIAWSATLPGPSAATPAVWKDHVFVSSTDTKSNTLKALCFDRASGKLLWQRDFATGINRDSRSDFASPSPATDGKLVVFFYGNGEMAAFDFSGHQLWRRQIEKDYGEFAFFWTFSSSPLLFDGKLYLQVLQRDVPIEGRGLKDRKNRSYILAMKPETGETLWRSFRPSQAVAESREAFTSPVPFVHNGRRELLVVGGDDLSGHDLETGKELWRWGTWNPTRIRHWRLVPSPVANQDVILGLRPQAGSHLRHQDGRSRKAGRQLHRLGQQGRPAGDLRRTHTRVLRRRLLRPERRAEVPLSSRAQDGQGEMDDSDAGPQQIRGLAPGR